MNNSPSVIFRGTTQTRRHTLSVAPGAGPESNTTLDAGISAFQGKISVGPVDLGRSRS